MRLIDAVHGRLCERCLAKGIIKPCRYVHHKRHFTPQNVTDTSIVPSLNNLELLCKECHEEEYNLKKMKEKQNETNRC